MIQQSSDHSSNYVNQVGTEWVYKGQNADQCLYAVAALARTTYNRLFLWLVDLCNRTLIVSIHSCPSLISFILILSVLSGPDYEEGQLHRHP